MLAVTSDQGLHGVAFVTKLNPVLYYKEISMKYEHDGVASLDIYLVYSGHGSCLLHVGFLLSCSSILKMEPTFTSETSADFQLTTRRYIPEDGTLVTKII
jgi:hypothetical protein